MQLRGIFERYRRISAGFVITLRAQNIEGDSPSSEPVVITRKRQRRLLASQSGR